MSEYVKQSLKNGIVKIEYPDSMDLKLVDMNNEKPIIVREDRMDSVDKGCSAKFVAFAFGWIGFCFMIISIIIALKR